MWFATRDGLNRFDGYSFKVFKSDFNEPSTLESNFIRCLAEDKKGNIWVGTDQGIYIFDPVLENFEILRDDLKAEILDIQPDKNGSIWFISDLKLYNYNPEIDSLSSPLDQQNISSFHIPPSSDTVWIGTIEGEIIQLSLAGDKTDQFKAIENSSTSNKRIEKIHAMDTRTLLIGTRKQGIKLLDLEAKSTKNILEKDYKNESVYV